MRARLLVLFVVVCSLVSVGMMAWAAAIPTSGNLYPSAGAPPRAEWIDRTVIVRQTVVVTATPTTAPPRYPTATRMPAIPTPTGTPPFGTNWTDGRVRVR